MTISMSAPTVLYIDDRPTLLELRKATLESHGLSIETVLSESAAMRLLEGTSVDAVLLEYKQEGMDREAIAYHIRQRFPNLPIVLISAYFEMPERILWLVDEYVLKSEIPEGLVRAIERVTCPSNADKAHRLAPRSNEPVPVEPAA
jgi:two-component system, OmpR family, response regulator QseB